MAQGPAQGLAQAWCACGGGRQVRHHLLATAHSSQRTTHSAQSTGTETGTEQAQAQPPQPPPRTHTPHAHAPLIHLAEHAWRSSLIWRHDVEQWVARKRSSCPCSCHGWPFSVFRFCASDVLNPARLTLSQSRVSATSTVVFRERSPAPRSGRSFAARVSVRDPQSRSPRSARRVDERHNLFL